MASRRTFILVVGTGRCGTSEVREILEDNGVDVGHRFHLPDKFNTRGYFEDRDFQDLNVMFYIIGLDKKDNPKELDMWRGRFDKLVKSKKGLWGVKDPGIADFPKLLNEYLRYKPHVIWCKRNREDTIQSFKRFRNLSLKEATHIYENRQKNLEDALKDYLEIDCYSLDKEKVICNFIKSLV